MAANIGPGVAKAYASNGAGKGPGGAGNAKGNAKGHKKGEEGGPPGLAKAGFTPPGLAKGKGKGKDDDDQDVKIEIKDGQVKINGDEDAARRVLSSIGESQQGQQTNALNAQQQPGGQPQQPQQLNLSPQQQSALRSANQLIGGGGGTPNLFGGQLGGGAQPLPGTSIGSQLLNQRLQPALPGSQILGSNVIDAARSGSTVGFISALAGNINNNLNSAVNQFLALTG